MLARSCSKSSKLGFNKQYVNQELPDVQGGFRKDRGTRERSNCQHSLDHRRSKRVAEKASISALLTMPKPLTVWITTDWKILQEMGIPDHLTCLLRNLYVDQEIIEQDMKQ